MTIVDPPHLRQDAQRNLERILTAARAVFAERGFDASVAEIAERADVGTATIFRRFPTKNDLCVAVIESELESVLAFLDSKPTVAEFMTEAVGRFVADRCLCEAGDAGLFERPEVAGMVAAIDERMHALVRREKRAGNLRRDVTLADIKFLLDAVAQAGVRLEQAEPGAWRRYVEIVLGGLR
jgi:AcrR family transcriptional regulator